ncbi:D-Ala-D-Ala carboxypeptidase family metallohydrolase [Oceaniglobus roseus]|uniref:D-Ala-D-Ala carboxypeptidase family metallohydrolase n=1 Tax=Oceaniglobus roseus TaxID=1737570 RepID=UPI000C7F2366|nr:caspase family protein [Kandeliimicrobium roseum]
MAKITVEELMAKMADLGTSESELAPYFVADPDASRAFAPRLVFNPETVEIPLGTEALNRSAAAMNAANWFARLHRKSLFYARLRDGYTGPLIVSEGDSWFQYPLLLKDTIDHLSETYAILSLGAAGDLLQHMADQAEYIGALEETGARILLLSGGGNDLVAGGALAAHLEAFDPDFGPEDYLLPSFDALVAGALEQYGRMFTQVRQRFPHVSILCHGYDYPVPNGDRWLGKPMESRGIRNKALQKHIAQVMMDRFNRGLRRAAGRHPHVTYIDCRGVVGDGRWHDGLHPTNEGYRDVAAKFDREIRRLANLPAATRGGVPLLTAGPFGLKSDLRAAALAAPATVAGGAARGISLHVGLNTVDPVHYDGWDGRLTACEADARAMCALAETEGFETRMLLTAEATRGAVTAAIEEAADGLQPGDMFLMTVSSHGGRIPDFNGDEDETGDDRMDETLCLYDFQLIDDELYMLWGRFRAGVRILMVPDTCHSGSMVRIGRPLAGLTFNIPDTVAAAVTAAATPRAMPLGVEDRVWRKNLEAYRKVSLGLPKTRESDIMNPLISPVHASVLNLGACRDDQFAMDGPAHGAFTQALLDTWQGGAFSGDYAAFRAAIDARIASPAQTPQLFDRLHKAPLFIDDRPFTIQPRAAAAEATAMPSAAIPAARPPVPAAAPQETEEETETSDQLPEAEVQAIFDANARGARPRSGGAAAAWADYADFDLFIRSLGLAHFTSDEFLVLGGSHTSTTSPCAGLNTYPPRALWPNIARTARVLDHLRGRLGRPIAITNAYRAPAYNACLPGTASQSVHMSFHALDFQVSGMAAPEVAMALRWLRDREGLFAGGIGRYNTFTHVDTRGSNATWPPAFRDAPLPESSPVGGPQPQNRAERAAMLQAVELAPAKAPRGKSRSAFAEPVRRDAPLEAPEIGLGQQTAKALVAAAGVVSFTDSLTPAQKEDVLLSTLFAQRAADAKVDPVADRAAWFGIYMDMLSLMGWSRVAQPFEDSRRLTGGGSFESVILGTLAAVATGAQMAVVQSALDALKALAEDDGRIKLFDLSTTKGRGSNFQIASAEAAGEAVSMALGAFSLSFEDARRNILFVSWGSQTVDYWMSAGSLLLSPSIFADVRPILREKLAESRKALLMDIEI